MAMAYEPLHHKYRPQTFAQLVGQEAIATTLSNALQQRRIPPAYLFSGPRGTGKTSSARILAKSLNCISAEGPTDQPCGMCEVCRAIAHGSALDVIEIDAASNTGVDNIRELIERAQFAPVQCRYKVYVIDECHMLSAAAFNALLKTLEEPPPRVVFVLATTDPQRVLPTIISRCQRFDFRRIPLEAMVDHLRHIADQEAIDISEDAVRLVAQVSQGGLRDAESLLDQLSLLAGQVTIERVWDLVGAVPERDLLALVQAIAHDDAVAVLDRARHLMDRGREPLIVLQNLASFYRDLLIAKTARDRNDLVTITPSTWAEICEFVQTLEVGLLLAGQQHLREAEGQVKNTTQPRLWLEVTLLGLLPSSLQASQVQGKHGTVHRMTNGTGNGTGADRLDGRSPHPSHPQPAPQAAPTTPNAVSVSAPVHPPLETAHPGPPASKPAVPPEDTRSEPPAPLHHPPEPPPSPPEPATETSGPSLLNLPDIWQQVIACLQPPATQALLRQQCRLLTYDGADVRISVTSRPLFKLVQTRLANVEVAFEQAFQRKVRVSLEIASESEPVAPPPPSSTSPSTAASPAAPPQPQSSPSVPSEPPLPVVPPSLPAPIEKSAPPPEAQPTVDLGLPVPELATVGAPETNGTTRYTGEDALVRASQSLAQFFNGQVVDLDDPLGGDSTPLTLNSTGASQFQAAAEDLPDEDEDDEDMPF